jgi:hypothetical protein
LRSLVAPESPTKKPANAGKVAIKRTHDTLEQKVADRATERSATKATDKPVDPAAVAKRDRDAQLREFADQAHGVNTDLGHALITTLASVDPTDMDVARFFVLGRHRPRTN